MSRTTVVIESPFAGRGEFEAAKALDAEANQRFAEACCLDAVRRGELPFASHLFFTRFLDDTKKEERAAGIEAGLQITKYFEKTAVYLDRGITQGMIYGIRHAVSLEREVDFRFLNQRGDDEQGKILDQGIDILGSALAEVRALPELPPIKPGLCWHRKTAAFYVVLGTVKDATNGHGYRDLVEYLSLSKISEGRKVREREEFEELIGKDLTPRFERIEVGLIEKNFVATTGKS